MQLGRYIFYRDNSAVCVFSRVAGLEELVVDEKLMVLQKSR